MTDMPGIRGVPSRKTSRMMVVITAAITLGIGAAGFSFRLLEVEPLPELSPGQAQSISRHISVVFDDNERSWSQWFRSEGMSPPAAPEKVFYSNVQPSPCAGTTPASGPFFCPLDNVAAFDLVFMSALRSLLAERGDMGAALVVARVYARHVQDSLGRGIGTGEENGRFRLQADCLTGVWAGLAQGRLGPVPDGFYGRMLGEAKKMSEESGRSPNGPSLDMFAKTEDNSREAAFRTGIETQDPRACPGPG